MGGVADAVEGGDGERRRERAQCKRDSADPDGSSPDYWRAGHQQQLLLAAVVVVDAVVAGGSPQGGPLQPAHHPAQLLLIISNCS